MRRFAVSFIPSEAMNMTAIISMMEAFQHVREKVEKTVHAIRRVRIRPGAKPKIPSSWIRPSYRKPVKILIRDG